MRKREIFSKIFGIALVFVLLGTMLGGLPGIGNAPQAEGAGTPQLGKASTVNVAVDGALGKTISIVYDFAKPRIEQTWSIPPSKPDVSAPSATTERKPQPANGYVSVIMGGLPQWSEAGLPVLPFRTARILLSYGIEMQDITVTYGNKVSVPGSYLVEPGQEPIPLSHEGLVNLTLPNSEVYNSSAPFPGKLYSDATVQSKTGCRMLLVNLHPVEYIPKTGKLSYYESMTVTVTLGGVSKDEYLSFRGLPQDRKAITDMVDNPEIWNSYPVSPVIPSQSYPLEPRAYEYVIITNEELEATPGPYNFQALRDDKISRGITATIVTTEWIYDNYDGTRPDGGEDNQTRLRNFIIDAYSIWDTRYVLLGGDGDGADVGGESGDEIIPHRGFASLDDDDIPADMYYACLDGTFDYNANGIYGEPDDGPGGGEVDLFAEVYVGRAPVDSQTEVANFVSKTLAYQNITLTDQNLRKVWMVGEYLGFGGVADWGGNYKDEIKQSSSAHNYTTVGIEDSPYGGSFDVSTLYDRDGSWSKSEIISIINDNTHLVNHLGHAYVDYVMKMYNPDVDGLTNDELYFIGYSQGCYDGAFDNRDDWGDYTSYDCISEHLTTEAHGAVAFIANSRYGWGVGGSTDAPSQHFDREFWDAVLGEGIFNIGIANQDSKEDNAGRISDAYDRWCYYEINLFGDPELSLKLYEGVLYDSHQIDDSAGGDGDGYPEPGESSEMPVTLRNTFMDTEILDVTATLSATTMLPTTIFTDDMEAGENGWTYDGLWHLTQHRNQTPTHSWYYGTEGAWNYNTSSANNGSLISPLIDLTGFDGATLSFWYWYETETTGTSFDERWVYISVNGGPFQSLQQLSADPMQVWNEKTIDLSSYAGNTIQIMFYFDTIDAIGNDFEGWYIDDVVLSGYTLIPDPYITITDNFEEYGNIPAGGTAASFDGYDFDIDPACPADHVVTFNLNITASNGGPWTDSFDVTIVERYTISGQVRDLSTGDPIANATVYYSGPVSGDVTTNTKGNYIIISLPNGIYSVYATASGYSDCDPVVLPVPSDATGIDFELGYSDIEVTPTELETWVPPNGTENKTLTIANLGNYKLNFSIAKRYPGAILGGGGGGGGAGEVAEAGWARVTPTLDGTISAGEWDDATVVNITATGIPAPVFMLVKNGCTHLYIAFVDTNDATHDFFDQVGIYFDEDHDGQWQEPPSSDSEGNFWIGDFGGGGIPADIIFQSMPDGNVYFGPVGVSGALGNATGYMVHEVAIEFGTSPLDCVGGDTIGLWVYCLDYSTVIQNGIWPESSTWNDPSTYGNLVLAVCPWLTIAPLSGTIQPGNSTNVSVTFNATGLDSGDYHCNLIISNNDPDENPTVVPVTMHVRPEGVYYDSHEIDDSVGGNGNNYPEPGESISMPVTLWNTAADTEFLNVNATLSATTTTMLPTSIFSEDFEGSWPGDWTVGDWDNTSGADYWAQSNYTAYSGDYSAYCAEVSNVSGQEYDNDMQAYMYRDVDLSVYHSVTLSYYYWLDCESYFDHLDIGYYYGSWHWVKSYDGYSGGWVQDSISIPTTATSVGFLFYSDGSVTYEGAYIDDIVLTGYNLVPVPDPYITITDNFEEYGNIPAGGTAASFDGYDFDIDPACPADHVVTFNLDVHASNGGPWTDSFDVTIAERYTISGQVRDLGTGDPIPNATVYYNGSGAVSGNATTNTTGNYKITDLSKGIYSVYATASGYSDSDPRGVKMPPDATGIDFELVSLSNPPNTPSDPSPGNHTTGISINADLSWTGGDPNAADTVNYSVYFGTNSTPPFRETIGPYVANQTSITYDPGTMNYDTKYYWKIVATDNHGASTTGPVWDFTSQQAPIVTYNLTISSTFGGSVTTPGVGTFGPYDPGEVVNLVAAAEPDYHFIGWMGDIDTIADANSRKTTITMNADYSITANFAAGAAEVDSEWGKVDTPYREDWTIAPNSDILVPASILGGEVIYVVGGGHEDNNLDNDYGPRLWKSEDSGVTWDDLSDKVWDADGLPDDADEFNPSNTEVSFNYVACAKDDSDFVAVALVDDNGTSTYCDDYQAVVISDDGGDNFAWAGDIADGSSTLNCVFDMKVSDEDTHGKRNIALGGVGTNVTCPTGLVFRYETGGLVGGRWVDASAYDGWDDDGGITSLAVTKVRFAPSWLDDRTILAVSHTATATYLQSGYWGNTKCWNYAAGFEEAVWVATDPSMWVAFRGAATGLALPTDYEGRNASTHYAWVYVDRTDGTGVIYRVKNGAVVEVSMQISGNPWLASISYLGSIEEGKALAGLLGDGYGNATDCCEGVQVYFNDGISDMDICCERWSDACKPPTGTMEAMVLYVAPNKAYAFVGGTGEPFEEGAVSGSLDDGDTWNQGGLVDTYIDYLSDVVKSADCSKTWVVSVNTEEDGVCDCDSVWLKADPLPEAPEYSGAWIREWCDHLTPNAALNSAQTPEIGLLRLAPEETGEALTVYLVDRGTDTVYYDGTEGLGCWEQGSSTVDEISDLAVQDEATVYVVGFDAHVAVSDDHGCAASWSSTMDSKVDKGHTIAVLGEGNVLVGGADGKVSYSDDNLATFLDGDASFTKLDDIGDGRVHVAFDSYFDTNDVIYAAVSNVVVDNMSYETPVNDPDNGIYRWVIGESSNWKDLGECTGTATPYAAQLGYDTCDRVEVGYYGIVLSNADGNPETDATTGGVLYAAFYDAAGNVTGVARCLNPAEEVACGEALWDYLIEDVNENHGAFTLEPSSLKICGCLTPDTNSKLWAVDNNWYYYWFATDEEDSDVGRLWTYEDCYAKSAPVLVAPADGAVVSCDPHYWWNDAFALKWDRQCDACSYNLQIAYDEDFTGLVLDISGKDGDCNEIDYEPTSGSNPSYVVAEGALGPGSCGTTFYWRVRSADAETGEIIHSPWSEARSFTVAGEPKYYNLTISSTSGGNVTTPGEGTYTCNASEVVNLVATADSGYQFVSWSGDTGTIDGVNSATTNITMTGDYSIVANFAEGAPAPVWSVGDNWVYNCSYENPGGYTEQDTNELNVTVVGEEAIGGEACYKLSGVFVPPATRDAADMPLTLHVPTTEIWNSKDHMEYLKQSSAIAELPGLPMTITWNYAGDYGWPFEVGKTWSYTTRVVAGPLDIITEMETKVLDVETITVPAGTFECYHLVAYEAAKPGTYTNEYWFNATVKSDVKMIDRFLWAGEEIRELTSYSVSTPPAQYNLTINGTDGGNVTTPGEGTFTYNASEVVDLVATADANYTFVNWTGDTGTIDDVNSAATNITMNGDYSIVANFAAVTGATLEGNVIFPGRGVAPNSTWIEDFMVRFYDGGNETPWSPLNATTNASGVFIINGITPGTYDIGIKNWTCLGKMNMSVSLNASETKVVDFGMPVEGDTDDNDMVDGWDYSLVLNNYGTLKIADPAGWAANEFWKGDFNRDEMLDGWDYSAVLNNYGKFGEIFIYTH